MKGWLARTTGGLLCCAFLCIVLRAAMLAA